VKTEVPSRKRPTVPEDKTRQWTARLRREPSSSTAFLWLIGIAGFSIALRVLLVTRVHGPTVFSDEIGYQKLAQSIGRTGRLALFNDEGLSYSPLYSLVLSPIYALGASAPSAYSLIKIVNAFLISLSIFPTYKIARFVLPRRFSLLVAGLGAVAPLMDYASFTISENVAYPLCLVSLWAMLEAVRARSVRTDAVLVGSILLATAARLQLIVLVPVALTAVVLAAIVGADAGRQGVRAALIRVVVQHRLFFGVVGAGLLVAGAAAFAGYDVNASTGRYAVVGTAGFPNLWHFLNLAVRHLAGIDLGLGVVPFVGALVAAFAFLRSPRRAGTPVVAFAAVAFSVTTWLLLEVAFDAALFDAPHSGDIPRIHERFLIYVVPFFLVALLAAYRLPESRAPVRVYWVAAAVTALLPAVIPFHTVVNDTINFESFGLHPFSRVVRGHLAAVAHAPLFAIWAAATLGLLFVYFRARLKAIMVLVLLMFVGISAMAASRIEDGGNYARSLLPKHADWVDRANPVGDVILVSNARDPTPELETAYFNFSISRVYYVCQGAFGAEFGEKPVTIDRNGRLREPSGFLRAPYAVGRASLALRGRVVARNREGHELLVAPPDDRVSIAPAKRAGLCKKGQGRRG
jgi:hypothetical protein